MFLCGMICSVHVLIYAVTVDTRPIQCLSVLVHRSQTTLWYLAHTVSTSACRLVLEKLDCGLNARNEFGT